MRANRILVRIGSFLVLALVAAGLVGLVGLAGCGEDCACGAGGCPDVAANDVADVAAPSDVAAPGDVDERCSPAACTPEWGLPEGVEAWCEDDGAGGRCAYRLVTTSEVYTNLLRIYDGASVYYGFADRLDRDGEPLGCVLPDSQGITPVEGNCCEASGGPDSDGDDRCDNTTTYWDTDTWSNLGFRIDTATQHRYVYRFVVEDDDYAAGRYRAEAQTIPLAMCGSSYECRHVFTMAMAPRGDGSCFYDAPAAIEHGLTGDCPPQVGEPLGPLPLYTEGLAYDRPPPAVDSLHPRYWEAEANLTTIAEAAAAAYAASPAGACAFPPEAATTPTERTCCAALGGPDADGDRLCEREEAAWESGAWATLGFRPAVEHHFAYETRLVDRAGGVKELQARAYGDFDCDSVQSTFARFVRSVPGAADCAAEVVPGVFTENESE